MDSHGNWRINGFSLYFTIIRSVGSSPHIFVNVLINQVWTKEITVEIVWISNCNSHRFSLCHWNNCSVLLSFRFVWYSAAHQIFQPFIGVWKCEKTMFLNTCMLETKLILILLTNFWGISFPVYEALVLSGVPCREHS